MKNYELSKNDSKEIQGIAILSMLCLHLFCTRDYSGSFEPLVFLGGLPLSYFFAQFSDCCVALFAFCSGYAHYILSVNKNFAKDRYKKLLLFLSNFWVVITLIILIGLITGNSKVPGSPLTAIGTYFAISESYSGVFWYVKAYIIFILISPLVIKLINKNKWVAIISAAICFVLGYYFFTTSANTSVLSFIIHKTGQILMAYFEYVLGMFFCKEKLLGKIGNFFDKIGRRIACVMLLLAFLIDFYVHGAIIGSLAVQVATAVLIILSYSYFNVPLFLRKIFGFLGTHSTNMWYIHMFWMGTFFGISVFSAKYPIVIFVLLVLVCIASSYIINMFYFPIKKLILKKL